MSDARLTGHTYTGWLAVFLVPLVVSFLWWLLT